MGPRSLAGYPQAVLPSGWTNWAYWQYWITGRVSGITGLTDLNMLNPALLAIANPGGQTTPARRTVRLQVRSANMTTGRRSPTQLPGCPPG